MVVVFFISESACTHEDTGSQGENGNITERTPASTVTDMPGKFYVNVS